MTKTSLSKNYSSVHKFCSSTKGQHTPFVTNLLEYIRACRALIDNVQKLWALCRYCSCTNYTMLADPAVWETWCQWVRSPPSIIGKQQQLIWLLRSDQCVDQPCCVTEVNIPGCSASHWSQYLAKTLLAGIFKSSLTSSELPFHITRHNSSLSFTQDWATAYP